MSGIVRKRATAYKVRTSDLVSGRWVEKPNGRYVITNSGLEVQRARVMGTVVDKFVSSQSDYGSITVDDGTETIRVKGWKNQNSLLNNVQIGDIVDVIGRVRKYQNEIYLIPELIIKVDDPNWELVRELEIMSYTPRYKSVSVKEEIGISDEDKPLEEEFVDKIGKVLEIIEEMDEGEGVNFDTIKRETRLSQKELDSCLVELLSDGTIYEPRPQTYRKL
ncbi:MAG: OB-fold nucleic acid binding domain-containing protein [Candidatus Jordarchaeum sp.]|uniref:OB-fold nucleic acid binding domain-containing protein n=1 Tax=Candidatus Jordarchaeum sp. TaxID=2823881 RepID=UPI0040498E1C